MKELKFEYVFGVLVYIGIMVFAFKFSQNADVVDKLVIAITNTLTAITTFIFTKHNPSKEV